MAEAHIAKTDAVLLAAIVAAQGALGLAYVRARDGRPVGAGIAMLFWAAEIAAILLKGPVAPALALVDRGHSLASPTATRPGCARCGRSPD